jgi:ribosomal protein L37AE/L43A
MSARSRDCRCFCRHEEPKIFSKSRDLLFALGSLYENFMPMPRCRQRQRSGYERNGVRDGEEAGMTAEEASMTTPAELHVASVASQRIALPACPECNDLQLAPAASEFVSKGQVRHFWSCEACGHEFTTSVKLPFVRGAPKL